VLLFPLVLLLLFIFIILVALLLLLLGSRCCCCSPRATCLRRRGRSRGCRWSLARSWDWKS